MSEVANFFARKNTYHPVYCVSYMKTWRCILVELNTLTNFISIRKFFKCFRQSMIHSRYKKNIFNVMNNINCIGHDLNVLQINRLTIIVTEENKYIHT